MACVVSGILRDLTTAILPNIEVTFSRSNRVYGQESSTVIPDRATTTTDGTGLLSITLFPGVYTAQAYTNDGAYQFRVGVPDDATADLDDIIDQLPELTPSVLTEVTALAAQVEADAAAAAIDADTAASAAESYFAHEVVATGLIPDVNGTTTRTANKVYLQGLIDANPTKMLVIPQLGTGVFHMNGTLVWPDGTPPLLRGVSNAVELQQWSADTQTVSYWKSSTGAAITMAEGALGGGAVQQTLYFRNSDGKQVTQAESVILGGGNFTTAMTVGIKAFIFWMGAPNGRGPRIDGGRITCRFDGDTEKASAIYLERTKSTGTSDAPLIANIGIARNGGHTAVAFTSKAFDIGFNLRGWASPEIRNSTYAGIEKYQPLEGKVPSARFTKACVFYGDSWNGLAGINPITEACSLFSADVGILVEGEFSEGGKALSNNIQETDYGVVIDNLAGTGQVWFTVSSANHCNSNVCNVLARGMRLLVVDGNYFAIKRTSGAANNYAVKIEGFTTGLPSDVSSDHQIKDNVFNFVANTGVSYGFYADYCYGAQVGGNTFISSNTPIYLGANTSGIYTPDNIAYIHPQETNAAKLAYVGSDFMTDLGAGNGRQVSITATGAQSVTLAPGGTVIDTSPIATNTSRNIFVKDAEAGDLFYFECRVTGAGSAVIRDGLSTLAICTAAVNQRITMRWNGTTLVYVERGTF